jgi:hypothetical protein
MNSFIRPKTSRLDRTLNERDSKILDKLSEQVDAALYELRDNGVIDGDVDSISGGQASRSKKGLSV